MFSLHPVFFLSHLPPEDEERPADDDKRRHQHFNDEAARDDAVSHVSRRFGDHVSVHRLHPQTENTNI